MFNVSGLHIAFYYFGLEHLLVNLYQYIKDGIENNQVIYLSMESRLYDELKNNLCSAGIPEHHLKFYSVKDMVLDSRGDKEKLREIIIELNNKNQAGFRLIIQTGYIINVTSKEDFLQFERGLSSVFKGINSSILCIYDFEDFVYNKGTIDQEIIFESHNTHPYILSEMTLKKPGELFF